MLGYGQMIQEARERANMRQVDLAEKIGVDRTYVSKIENEKASLTIAQVNSIVAALPLSAEQLLLAMGVALAPSLASRFPKKLLDQLLTMRPEAREQLAELLATMQKTR